MAQLPRRTVLKAGAATLAAGGLTAAGAGRASALSVPPAPTGPATLDDVEHVVIWLQENRSFDHYFGTYPGVRGFQDPGALPGVFTQTDSRGPGGKITPFRLNTTVAADRSMCLPDVAHDYGDQHTSWNNGAMDKWGQGHAGDNGVMYMGYYERADMPYYFALADAFTLCDAYHCSVLGPTTPNRLYAMTGMIDPQGLYGGPVEGTQSLQTGLEKTPTGLYSPGWQTYPEALQDAGVSWKVYGNPDGDDQYNPMLLFQQYYPQNFTSPSDIAKATELAAGVAPQFPEDFLADLAAGTLPQVSWVIPPVLQSEHPSFAVQDGENLVSTVVQALFESPLWDKLAMFLTYDENGGFFDHVPPPVPLPGTAGEFPKGDTRPIGMGYRVPMIVVSPFSQGGFVCRDTFDHTSLLQFLERKFDVPAVNVTDWRRQNAGDLTSAFNFAGPVYDVPASTLLALAPVGPSNPAVNPECPAEELTSTTFPAPATSAYTAPQQESGTRPSPSGLSAAAPPPALAESSLPVAEVAAGLALAAAAAVAAARRART